MNFTDPQIATLRAALIAGRQRYCADMAEHGEDGLKRPEPNIKAAMEMLGMQWAGDESQIYGGDEWSGNEQFKMKPISKQMAEAVTPTDTEHELPPDFGNDEISLAMKEAAKPHVKVDTLTPVVAKWGKLARKIDSLRPSFEGGEVWERGYKTGLADCYRMCASELEKHLKSR